MRTWMAGVVVGLLMVGCGDKDDDDTGGSADSGGADSGTTGGGEGGGGEGGGGEGDGEGTDPDDCDTLTPEACADRDDCVGIDGRPMHDDGAGGICVDWDDTPTVLGCMDGEMGCGDAETLAAPPDDPSTCWWFSSTCVPAGWTSCGTDQYGECVD